ncbi:MAG: hypothetical protein PUC23_01645 [bacterium]|nr:hypothetical protein [bacterium]
MQVKDIIESYLKQIEEYQNKILNDEKTSLLINNFYNNSIDELQNIIGKDIKQIEKYLKEEVVKSLTSNLNEMNKNIKGITNLLNKSIKDMVVNSYSNYLFNMSIFDSLIKESKSKISLINNLDKEFLKKYDDIFELFLYNISIKYDLKGEVNTYNLVNKTMNQNKKILFDNLKIVEDELKISLLDNYEHYLNLFINDIMIVKDGINKKNQNLLVLYQEKYVEQNVLITTNEKVKELSKKITTILDNCHNKILKLEKGRNTKDKITEEDDLKTYLINFTNTLFDKSQNTLLKINLITSTTKEELEKNIEKYQELIYKICDFYYNFDRPFSLYKKTMLNRTYFLPTSTCLNISNLIENAKDEIITEIRKNIIRLFEDNINLMNKLSYKRLMLEQKLNNYYKVLTQDEIEKLLK